MSVANFLEPASELVALEAVGSAPFRHAQPASFKVSYPLRPGGLVGFALVFGHEKPSLSSSIYGRAWHKEGLLVR